MKYRFASGCALLMEDIALQYHSRTVSVVFLVLSTLILAGCPGRTSIEKINRDPGRYVSREVTIAGHVQLQVGAPLVEIEVRSTIPQVETISPSLGQIVTGETIRNAPLNGRNALDLALLMPGVTPSNADDTSAGTLNITGNRSDSVAYLLDGGLNNDQLDNGVVYIPNPDTIAEFRVLTSNYPAEFGRNSGGVVSMPILDWNASPLLSYRRLRCHHAQKDRRLGPF